uniref:Uncharacterized protein n=1 Tax=Clastoptera arizonana TaxID=38151 RepID=A0A1B6EE08_9HEMI
MHYIVYIFIPFFLINTVRKIYGYQYDDLDFTDPMEYVNEDGVYYTLNSILDFFHQDEFRESIGVKELLQRYQDSIKRWEDRAKSNRNHQIFIVVEGINPHNRKVAAQLLAQKLSGKFLANPARTGVGPILDDQKVRKAFHALNKYTAANYVRAISLYQPVVLVRYWFDHATFIMAKRFGDKNLPPSNSSIYQFPEDLLKPNITFFLNDADLDRMSKTQSDFAKRLIKIYRTVRDPAVVEIVSKGPPRLLLQKMMDYINEFIE